MMTDKCCSNQSILYYCGIVLHDGMQTPEKYRDVSRVYLTDINATKVSGWELKTDSSGR